MTDLVEMTIDECLERLEKGTYGRVALATPVGPRIIPVNYAMYDDAIVFRTTPYSEIGTYGANLDAAFEVDDVDVTTDTGWSVVAVGKLTVIDDPVELVDLQRGWEPRPWADGMRRRYFKLVWRNVTGRSLGRM